MTHTNLENKESAIRCAQEDKQVVVTAEHLATLYDRLIDPRIKLNTNHTSRATENFKTKPTLFISDALAYAGATNIAEFERITATFEEPLEVDGGICINCLQLIDLCLTGFTIQNKDDDVQQCIHRELLS